MKITRTKHGARMSQGGAVLSEVLAKPGPTHSVFDLLAALVHVLAPGPRVGVLGFVEAEFLLLLRALVETCGPGIQLDLEHTPEFERRTVPVEVVEGPFYDPVRKRKP